MTEVFDMDMNDLLGEDSEFIDRLIANLEHLGVEIDAESLSTVLHEYEMTKMEFLKHYIMRLLESRGANLSDFEEGPLKIVFSNNGIDFGTADQEDEDQIDTTVIS